MHFTQVRHNVVLYVGPMRLLSARLEDSTTLGTVAGQLSSRPITDDNLLLSNGNLTVHW